MYLFPRVRPKGGSKRVKYLTLVAFLWIMLEKYNGGIGKYDDGIATGRKSGIIIIKNFCGECGERKVNNGVIREETKRSFT